VAATKKPEIQDIENRFRHHPPTGNKGAQHEAVRGDLERLAKKFQKTLPDGREKSLVLTKLEEAMFWANAAIARHDESPAAAMTPRPSGLTSTRKKTAARKQSARKVTRRRRAEPPI